MKMLEKNKYLLLLISLIIFFFIQATTFFGEATRYVISIIFTLLIISSIYVISDHHKLLTITTSLIGVLIITMRWVGGDIETKKLILDIAVIVFFTLITSITFRSVIQYKKICSETLYGATCTYLLIGLTWSYIYELLYSLNKFSFVLPGYDHSKEAINFIYYSFVTLTTLGYGDYHPITHFSQTFSWVEAVSGQIYLTLLMAQLVGLYIKNKVNK